MQSTDQREQGTEPKPPREAARKTFLFSHTHKLKLTKYFVIIRLPSLGLGLDLLYIVQEFPILKIKNRARYNKQCIPVIPTLRRFRQENSQECEVNLGYSVRLW